MESGALYRLMDGAELCGGVADIATDTGRYLQHAFGDVMFGFSRRQFALDIGNQRGGILAEVVSRRVNDLQLQLNTKRKRR